MDIQTIVIALVVIAVVLIALKKFKGGCCGGGKNEVGPGEGEKHDHGDGSCCGHKH